MAQKQNRKAYFEDYYQQKREELLRQRSERYRGDSEYREKARERARERRARQREERERLRAEGKLPSRKETASKSRRMKPVLVSVGGSKVVAYPARMVAEKIGRSVGTLNHWERVGLMPRTPLVSDGGSRYYTEGMLLVLQLAVSRRGRIHKQDKSFREEVEKGWCELGFSC